MSYRYTGEYYCKRCKKAHHFGSKIGKEHIKFASKHMQKKVLLERGDY